jgi:hypothetical protein
MRGFTLDCEREIARSAAGDGRFALAVAGEREYQNYGGRDRNCEPICEFSASSHQVL